MPTTIDINAFQSIPDVFAHTVRRFYDRPAVANMGKTLTYGELDAVSIQFASYLQNVLKLPKGTRVAVMLPNLLQYPVAVFGILRAGCVVVNVNPLYTPRELEYQLNDSGAEVLLVAENFARVVQDTLPRTPALKTIIVTGIGDMLGWFKAPVVNFVVKHIKKLVPKWKLPDVVQFKAAMKAGAAEVFVPVSLGHDDLAFLQYTGGTTGVAKGAMLLHKNIIANMLQAGAWIKSVVTQGEEVIVTALPLYHIFSLTANLMIFTHIGALNVLITNPRDIGGFIADLKRYPVTAMTGVNTLFNALLNHPDFASIDFSTWKLTLGGGMAVQKAVADKWQEVTGLPLIEAYGLTETSPAACINPMNLKAYNGTIGLPIPGTLIEIRDPMGREVGQGQPGELFIKGPQVMRGYWNRPTDTAKTLDPYGFLATGDIAMMTADGFVKLVDRKKDMILVSGFNVYPNEVEDVIATLPGVLEVACVGVDDDKSGEIVKVFIVKKDPELTEEQVLTHCRRNLTPYKIPKQVEFRTELPKTNVGKILRRALRSA
jgi:long-chain acyl-CoA synthetase